MPAILFILLKINLVLLLFTAAYFFVLRKFTFYGLNRFFLIVGILFSTCYPFINLTSFYQKQQISNPKIATYLPRVDVNQLIKNQEIASYWNIVLIAFYLGVAVFALKLLLQLASLYQVHQQSEPGFLNNFKVRFLKGKSSPFSFWKTIYINPKNHTDFELNSILVHEHIHVKQLHTLDILIAEVSVIFYWFNPGVWLMKKAIKENIEFITDAKILNQGIDKRAYQYSLLEVSSLQPQVALVNHFNLSDLKIRIKMMNAKPSAKNKLIAYVVILPVLLMLSLAFTVSKSNGKILAKAQKNEVFILKKETGFTLSNKPKSNAIYTTNPKENSIIQLKPGVELPKKFTLSNIMIKLDSVTDDGFKSLKTLVFTKPKPENQNDPSVKKIVKGFAFKIDSIESNKVDLEEVINKIKLQIKDLNIGNAHETPKIINIKGKAFIFNPNTNLDSIKTTYYINGVKVNSLDLEKGITPEQIKEVKVVKNDEQQPAIYIITKEN